jgi:hypothetical protein
MERVRAVMPGSPCPLHLLSTLSPLVTRCGGTGPRQLSHLLAWIMESLGAVIMAALPAPRLGQLANELAAARQEEAQLGRQLARAIPRQLQCKTGRRGEVRGHQTYVAASTRSPRGEVQVTTVNVSIWPSKSLTEAVQLPGSAPCRRRRAWCPRGIRRGRGGS